MKRILVILLLFVLSILPLSACAGGSAENMQKSENTARVVILAGQSNMEGWTFSEYAQQKLDADEYTAYAAGAPNVRLAFYKTPPSANGNPFQGVSFGKGMDGTRFGPEVGIARTLGEKCPETKFYLIKYAVGGTSLYSDWISPSAGGEGRCYKAMIEYVSNILLYLTQQGVSFTVSDFCFMQGEADAGLQSTASEYAATLRLFMQDIREILSFWAPEKGIRFIDGQISDSSLWPYYEQVNESKLLAAEGNGNNVVLDTIGQGLKYDSEPLGAPDLAHYDALSMLELGTMFGEAISES